MKDSGYTVPECLVLMEDGSLTSVKVCPHCGQPAKLDDIECVKCGFAFRFRVTGAEPDVPSLSPAYGSDHIHLNQRDKYLLLLFLGVVTAILIGIYVRIGWRGTPSARVSVNQPVGMTPSPDTTMPIPTPQRPGEDAAGTVPVIDATYDQVLSRVKPLMDDFALTPDVTRRVLHDPHKVNQYNDVTEWGWRLNQGWVFITFRGGLGYQIANRPLSQLPTP